MILNYEENTEIKTINKFANLKDYQIHFKNHIEKYLFEFKGKFN
jgi:hypothetical protein